MTTATIRTGSTAMRELRAMMRGGVVSRGDDDYSRTRQVWNRAVEDQPALFAVCETSADVQRRCGVHVNIGALIGARRCT